MTPDNFRYLFAQAKPLCYVVQRALFRIGVSLAVGQLLSSSSIADDTQLQAQLSKALREYTYRNITDVVYEDPRFALVDLDGDGRPDGIVLMSGPVWCDSGGCRMYIFKGYEGGFEFVSVSTMTSSPIRVSKSKSHGWRSLIVNSKAKGEVILRFTKGARYPGIPSLQPSATRAQIAAADVVLP